MGNRLKDASLKDAYFRAIAIGVGLLIGAVFVELTIRLVIAPLPSADDIVYQPHPVLGHTLRANHEYSYTAARGNEFGPHDFVTDEQGLIVRDGNPNIADDDAYRIMMLGDSFVQGNEVAANQNMSVLLQQQIALEVNKPVQVVNTGLSGYDATHYYLSYGVYKEQFSPDLVVAVFYIGNDITSSIDRYLTGRVITDEAGTPVAFEPTYDLAAGTADSEFALESFREQERRRDIQVVRYIRELILVSYCQFADSVAPSEELPPPGPVDLFRADSDLALADTGDAMFKDEYSEEDLELLNLTIQPLALLNEAVEADGSELLVVIMPGKAQIPGQSGVPRNESLREGQYLSADNPQQYIMDFCGENDIDCLNLLPIMRDDPSIQYYWLYDQHLTNAGHEFTADAVANEILMRFEP